MSKLNRALLERVFKARPLDSVRFTAIDSSRIAQQRREAENEYEVGETMSDETYLLQRIYGLETELHYLAESSRQQQFRHNTDLGRLQNDNRKLQARLGVLQAENTLQARLDILQAENNTLRVQLKAALSVISHLEQQLKFHLKSLSVQGSVTAAAA